MSITVRTFDCGGEINQFFSSRTQIQGSSKIQLYYQKKPYVLGSTKALSYNNFDFAGRTNVVEEETKFEHQDDL